MLLNLYFIGTVAFFIILAHLIGMTLPSRYYVSSVLIMQVPASCLWNRMIKFAKYHTWRLDLKYVKIVSDNEWIETDKNNDQISYRMTILEERKKLKIEVLNKNLPYQRSWTIDMHTVGKLSIIRISEEGEIFQPFFRTFATYIYGLHTSENKYLGYLEQVYRKKTEPQVLKKTIHVFDVLNLRPIIQPFIKTTKCHQPYLSFE